MSSDQRHKSEAARQREDRLAQRLRDNLRRRKAVAKKNKTQITPKNHGGA